MQLTVVTPEKTILEKTVDEVIVNTTEGEIGILPNHMPLVASVKPGEMILKIKGNTEHYALTGGFLEVSTQGVTILADYAIRSEEIEVEKAMDAKRRAEELLKKSKEGVSQRDFAVAQAELVKAVLQINIANRRRRERSSLPQR